MSGAGASSLQGNGVAGPLEEGLEIGREAEERVVQDAPELQAGMERGEGKGSEELVSEGKGD